MPTEDAPEGTLQPGHLELNVRAAALLVAMRRGPRPVAQLADAIADTRIEDTRSLLAAVVQLGQVAGTRLVSEYPGARWGLDTGGVEWLGREGLDVDPRAKAALLETFDTAAEPVPSGSLLAKLRGTQVELASGRDFVAIGAHERARYAAAKARQR